MSDTDYIVDDTFSSERLFPYKALFSGLSAAEVQLQVSSLYSVKWHSVHATWHLRYCRVDWRGDYDTVEDALRLNRITIRVNDTILYFKRGDDSEFSYVLVPDVLGHVRDRVRRLVKRETVKDIGVNTPIEEYIHDVVKRELKDW